MRSQKDRSLLILFSVVAVDLIGFGVVVPILPFYAVQYGAGGLVLGLILTSYSAMQFLFAPFWGKISDRFGRRPVMILTIGGVALGLLVLGTARSLLMIFVGRILSGIFSANISVASAYVADVTTDENRARGMGLIGAAFGVGFILGPALGGLLSAWGYHVPILAAALLAAINMVYASSVLREPGRHRAVQEELRPSAIREPGVFWICLLYFIFSIGVNQLESMFAFFVMDRFGYDARDVAWILVLMALVMVAIQGGLIGRLVRAFGEKRLLVIGTAVLSIGFFFVPRSPTVGILLIPLLVSSLGRGLSQPSLMSLVSKRSSSAARGGVMGNFQASASLGRVVGPIVAGSLYDRWSSAPFYFAACLIALVFVGSTRLKGRSGSDLRVETEGYKY